MLKMKYRKKRTVDRKKAVNTKRKNEKNVERFADSHEEKSMEGSDKKNHRRHYMEVCLPTSAPAAPSLAVQRELVTCA